MKLQKQLSRKVKGKEYPKWVVTISPEKIKKVGWKEGTELNADVMEDKIVLQPNFKLMPDVKLKHDVKLMPNVKLKHKVKLKPD